MPYRLITAVCKADVNLKSAIFRRNPHIFPQPKRLVLRQFLSQLSSHPPKGFDKPFNQHNRNKSGAGTGGGIGADRKSSSLSGGLDGGEGGEEKNKGGPGSDGKNKTGISIGTASILGVCWVYSNQKDLNWKSIVDNFLLRSTVECEGALAIPEEKSKRDETVQTGPNAFYQEMTGGEIEKESDPVDLDQLVNRVKSTDPQIQCSAVNSLLKLLTSGRKPPIDFLISCNILPTLVDCLSSPILNLQLDALLALKKIVQAGTSEQSQAIVEAGAVPHFLRLLKSSNQNVCEIALSALEVLILEGPKLRDWVINLGVVPSLLNCILPDTKRKVLHEVLRVTAWTLKYLPDGGEQQIQMVIDSGILPKLVQLLNHGEVKVQLPALGAVDNIFEHGTNNQVQAVLNCDALSHFHNLLNHPKKNICEKALWVLSKVAERNVAHAQSIIDAGLVPLIFDHLEKGEFQTQKAAAQALSLITFGGEKEQVTHLIDCGVIPLFCNLLNCTDSYVVLRVLFGIYNILVELSDDPDCEDKACTLIKECGGWDKIQTLQNHENLEISKNAHDISIIMEKLLLRRCGGESLVSDAQRR